MSKLWKDCLFPIFLSTISSCTFASFEEEELESELNYFAIRAINSFRFPKVSLSYSYTEEEATIEESTFVFKRYQFDNNVGDKELHIIVNWMIVYWRESQLSKERNYENIYFDKDIKGFSAASLLSNIEKAYNTALNFAMEEEKRYYSVNAVGMPTIGDIND